MKNIFIKKWFGRMGNNIIQIKNALHIALYFNYNVILPPSKLFNTQYIVNNPTVTIEDEKIIDELDFYYFDRTDFDSNILKHNYDKVKQIIRDIFIISTDEILDKDTLVIHIRGGDIFTKRRVHPDYITPPLSYYCNIIDENSPKQIIIVSEDKNNYCIKRLLRKYKNIQFAIQSFEKDVALLLSAQKIVESFGTFSSTIAYLSKNIKTIYRPSYQFDFILLDCKIININLEEYREKMYPWKNTGEQRKLMLYY